MEQPYEGVAAVVNTQSGKFELEPIEVGPLRSDEVLVQIVATGLCHTDLAVRDQRRPVPLPAILGHEGAGIVRRVGNEVRSFARGDNVVLSYLSCGACPECSKGQTACCANLGRLCFAPSRPDGTHAVTGKHGKVLSDRFFGQSSFATWAVANERNLIAVPADLPLEIMGPLGCGVITGAGAVWSALNVIPGSSFAVFGAGGVGLSAVLAARSSGAEKIIAIDRVDSRLDLARELGATHVVKADETDDIPRAIRTLIGDGVSYALDTTASPAAALSAFRSLRQCGALAIAATRDREQVLSIPQFELMTGCRSICGVIQSGGSAQETISKILRLYRAGSFPFDRLIRFYDFEDINTAVEDCESGRAVKPVLLMKRQQAHQSATQTNGGVRS